MILYLKDNTRVIQKMYKLHYFLWRVFRYLYKIKLKQVIAFRVAWESVRTRNNNMSRIKVRWIQIVHVRNNRENNKWKDSILIWRAYISLLERTALFVVKSVRYDAEKIRDIFWNLNTFLNFRINTGEWCFNLKASSLLWPTISPYTLFCSNTVSKFQTM